MGGGICDWKSRYLFSFNVGTWELPSLQVGLVHYMTKSVVINKGQQGNMFLNYSKPPL